MRDVEEIEIRADGSIRTGAIKEDFYCPLCTMNLPPHRATESPDDPDVRICKGCRQEYF